MKTNFVLFIFLYFFFLSTPVWAYHFEKDGIYYNILPLMDNTVEVTYNSTKSYSGDVIIPDTVEYDTKIYHIVSIGDWAFSGSNLLNSIKLPDGITRIGERAFGKCSSLSSIKLPDSLTYIGDWAFGSCSSLSSINIPEGVITIGEQAFWGCSSLSSIKLPDSLTHIGEEAFYSCSSLNSITLPKKLTSIGKWAFVFCKSLTSIMVDSENPLYSSENGILYNKEKTVLNIFPEGKSGEITLSKDIKSVKEYAFYHCTSLSSINVDARNLVYSSENGILYNKEKTELIACPTGKIIDEITLPKSLESIEDWAFSWCFSLDSIVLPESVTNIGANAFRYCISLTSIKLPNSMTSIGENAFNECNSLKSINLPKGIKTIAESTFYGCVSLNQITLPEGITSIGKYAFFSCSFSSIILPASVTSIDEHAFFVCSELTHIYSKSVVPPVCKRAAFQHINPECILYVPFNSKNDYKEADEWEDITIIEEVLITVSLNVSPSSEVGIVSGKGKYFPDEMVVITATPNEGYLFKHWLENEKIVSTSAEYSFRMEEYRMLTAVFEKKNTSMQDDYTSPAIVVYPNPIQTSFSIEGIKTSTANLQLIDLNGRIVLEKTVVDNETISIESFPAGVYLLVLQSGSDRIEQKIIKQGNDAKNGALISL